MTQQQQTINGFLVDVFNDVLRLEERSLRKERTGLSLTELHVLETVQRVSEERGGTMADVAAALGSPFCTMCASFPFGYDHPDFPPLRYVVELQKWSYANADMDRDWDRNWREYVAAVKELCRYAAAKNIRVLVEPHPYRWVNSAQSMRRLIDHVQEENLGFNFDPSHLFACGDMPEWAVYAMRGRLWHTHFSDNDTITNAHWRPGLGKMNWKAILRALKDIGYDGALNFELEDVPGAATPGSASAAMSNEMEEELAEAKSYITNICQRLDIALE